MNSAHVSTSIVRHVAGTAPVEAQDDVAAEEPLEIRVEGRSVAVTMRTPGQDEELAVGFLLTENVIASAHDLLEVNQCPATAGQSGNVVDVLLRRPGAVDFDRLTRHVFSSSSCGLCGKASIDALQQRFPPLPPSEPVPAAVLLELPARLQAAQATFQRTGGLHAAALFGRDGALLVVREDVGRHNAVDKVIGHLVRRPSATPAPALPRRKDRATTATPAGLLVSGRVSFEIIQKALAARLGLIVAVSAPTSLAVEFARANGQTLVGFLRPGRLNVYAGHVAP
jgi:FdhD protein